MKLALLLYLAKFSTAGPFYPNPGKNCGRYPNTQNSAKTRHEAEADIFARVLGGVDASQEQHPWQVYLMGIDMDAKTKSGMTYRVARRKGLPVMTCSCGGTIISPNWILTAAHCCFSCVPKREKQTLKYIEIHMSLKEGKLMSAYTGYSRVTQADYISVHPGFGNLKAGQDMIHDIALLHSGEKLDLKYADEITPEPACLPMPEFCARDGDHVVVSGWGKTLDNSNGQAEVLQTADLYLENHLNCQNKFTFPYVQAITDDMVCAMGMNGEDSCQGDSGGPLMINKDEVATLYGVVSWGVKCGGDHPGVYTRVSKYVDWIEKSTQGKDQIHFGNDKKADVTPCTEPFEKSESESVKTCGNPEYGRIETGEIEIFNYPWYYLIQACKSRACVTRACPATLISENYLLTAASCVSWVNGEKAEGVLVSRDITDAMVADGPNVNLMALGVSNFDVSTEITMHPNLDLRSAKYNLALIKLTHKLLPGKDVPICLPTADGFCLDAMDKKKSMLESLVIGDNNGFEIIDVKVNRESECNRWYGIDFPKDTEYFKKRDNE